MNTTPSDSGNNNNIVVPVTPSLPHTQPKKSPSLLPYNPSPYQPSLQLSLLDSDKQCTKDEYHMYDMNDSDNNKPLPLENNDTGSASTRKTRSATKSSTTKPTNVINNYVQTMTNTNSIGTSVGTNTFPDTMDEIQDLDPYDQAVLLYRKYISESAAFCINISSQSRKTLFNMFGNDKTEYKYDEEQKHYVKICVDESDTSQSSNENQHDKKPVPNVHDLYHCFDDSRSEIYFLLNSSLKRFKLTGAFSEYLNIVVKI